MNELSAKADPINSSLAGLAGACHGQAGGGRAVQDSLFSLGGLDSCLTLQLEGEFGSVFNPWTRGERGSESCSRQFHFLKVLGSQSPSWRGTGRADEGVLGERMWVWDNCV